MVTVTLYQNTNGIITRVGTLEFFSLPVNVGDVAAWLEFHGGECGGHVQVRLSSPGIVTPAEVVAIGKALCRDEMQGHVGIFEWQGV
jgi:hypothetical protein